MPPAPPPWQISLARLEGALPFLIPALEKILALRSLQRLWHIYVRDFPFENRGLEHNPGPDANELMRSWYAEERRHFLSWISRRAHPPLAHAANIALAAKGVTESFSNSFADADLALARLDALLPASDPVATLGNYIAELRAEERNFLETGSEIYAFEGRAFERPSPKGSAWAASLAIAMRPQLFGMGAAPFALAGIAPRGAFRPKLEVPIDATIAAAIASAVAAIGNDLEIAKRGLDKAEEVLSELYTSSRVPDVWQLVLGSAPITRAEIARALGVTKRTASQSVTVLERSQLVTLRTKDKAVVALKNVTFFQ